MLTNLCCYSFFKEQCQPFGGSRCFVSSFILLSLVYDAYCHLSTETYTFGRIFLIVIVVNQTDIVLLDVNEGIREKMS